MGLATDGGLLVPETIPKVSPATLRTWAKLSFQELAVQIMSLYVGQDISDAELRSLAERSYNNFAHPHVTPLVRVNGRPILELFHGPTAAFKDIALQWLGNLFALLLARTGDHLNILGATSGDTGSAAIYGMRGKERIRIFILHPLGRVSPIQERQMTTVLDSNVYNIAIRGTFDDGQRIVKSIFNDLEFKRAYQLGAINSINWARILAQIVYYFYAWGQISSEAADKLVAFSVPTGNFGDIFAGYMAWRMGLPVARLILATNQNDILTRFIRSGIYQVGEVHPTLSPSMDIQIASNFERYLYYLVEEDAKQVRELMQILADTGSLQVTQSQHLHAAMNFTAVAVSEEEILAEIGKTYQETGYIFDPHTAVGVRATNDDHNIVCLATAHPAKFDAAVHAAIGRHAPAPPALHGLMTKPTRCTTLDATEIAIKQYIRDALA